MKRNVLHKLVYHRCEGCPNPCTIMKANPAWPLTCPYGLDNKCEWKLRKDGYDTTREEWDRIMKKRQTSED